MCAVLIRRSCVAAAAAVYEHAARCRCAVCSYQVFTPQAAAAEEVVVTRGAFYTAHILQNQINQPRSFYDLSSLNSSYSCNKKIHVFQHNVVT